MYTVAASPGFTRLATETVIFSKIKSDINVARVSWMNYVCEYIDTIC